jgi:MscS family membrane protein
MEDLLTLEFAGLALWRLVAALVIVVLGFAIQGVLFDRMMRPLEQFFDETQNDVDDYILEQVHGPFAWFVRILSVYLGLRILDLPDPTLQSLDLVARTAGTILVAWVLFRIVDVLVHILEGFTSETDSEIDDQLVPVVRRIIRFFLVTVAALVVVQQWGYNVGSLIAGLGIGGLAFALAARQMLTNWFGALMIFTDRPFKVGEWVATDAGEGEIEEVGLRSTRIRTYGRNQIVVPNSEMASNAVTNKSSRDRRRICTELGLVYDTTHDQLQQILTEIRDLLDTHEQVWDGDWRAYFVEFGDSALKIEVSCFTTDPDATLWRETRQELFLAFLRIVEEAGSELAFPTQSVRVDGGAEL